MIIGEKYLELMPNGKPFDCTIVVCGFYKDEKIGRMARCSRIWKDGNIEHVNIAPELLSGGIFFKKLPRKKIYLYAGYYEMFITDNPMPKRYALLSTHYSVDKAEESARRLHPDDHVYYKVELFPEDLNFVLESLREDKQLKVSKIGKDKFYIC